jgi:signal transduction histidine kinase/ActR/RegA family two-component response regulator
MSGPNSKRQHLIESAVLGWMNDLSPQGILLTDDHLNIIGWNHWLEEHTGRRTREVQGRSLFDIFPDLVKRGLNDHYMRALEGQVSLLSQRLHGYIFQIPIVSVFKEYPYMQQSARIAPLMQDGTVIGTITIIDDVTERVARESELQSQLEARSRLLESEARARQEAEKANRLKDEFLATISHELRTPLTAIVGWSQLLRKGNLDPATAARGLEIIDRNAHSQTQLISDLLDVSRIISNKLLLNVDQVSLPSIIEGALDAIAPEAQSKGIHLQRDIASGFPQIFGDSERLQQVIWNLLSNAIKFTPRDGSVQVRLERTGPEAVITVTDSGIGIDPKFIPHVFDRFRQASSATTRAHGGLGLGLSIVRQLAELHGGSAEVFSEGEGKGSTFTIRLPINLADVDDAGDADRNEVAERDDASVLSGMKILVVDDEKDAREFLRTAVERYGSHVETATSVPEALEAIEHERPDFLVSDIGMPEEDGHSLIRKIRALPEERGGRTPAIALSAYARSEDQLRAVQAGFQMHLSKPVEPEELVSAIARVVGRRKVAGLKNYPER